jgi:hypothetical protein
MTFFWIRAARRVERGLFFVHEWVYQWCVVLVLLLIPENEGYGGV